MFSFTAERLKLWERAELGLITSYHPEHLRTAGLLSIERQNWKSVLLRLEEAVHQGVRDSQVLDALGEAAYQSKCLSSLLSFEPLYQNPQLSIHMARAFLILGQRQKCREYLNFSEDTLLKIGVKSVLEIEKSIEQAIEVMLKACEYPQIEKLNFVEFWQALAPIAECAKRDDLVSLAERRMKALAFNRPVTHFNQSLRFLNEGEWGAAWRNYDWRLVPGSPCAQPTFLPGIPMWEGEFLKGKYILVLTENGFGDQIFSLRFADLLIKEGAEVELAVSKEIFDLTKTSFQNSKVHKIENVRDPQYWNFDAKPDFWTYAFSIPSRLWEFNPPKTDGYLKADKNLSSKFQEIIKKKNPKSLPVYGITWHGDIRTSPMRTRAYSINEFLEQIAELNSPSLIVALQKDITEQELEFLDQHCKKTGSALLNIGPELNDFSQTAAWIMALDRLWSCDTANAHLGGALGAPTTAVIRNKAIWQWIPTKNQDSTNLSNETLLNSVWYNSVKIKYALTPRYSYMFEIPEQR